MDVRNGSLAAIGIAHRRKAMWVLCALVAAAIPFDFLQPEPRPVLIAARAAWCLVLLVTSLLQRPERPALANLSLTVAALACAASAVAVVASRSGDRFAGLAFLMTLPLLSLAVTPHMAATSIAVTAVVIPGGSLVMLHAGAQTSEVIRWAVVGIISAGAAVSSARANRREAELLLATERERLEGVRSLAESEQRRDRAERLALVGQLAAGLAHEMNNPLAFVRSNLQWLRRREIEAPGDAEAHEVLDETLCGVDRMAKTVAALQAAARERSDERGPCRLDQALEGALRLASVRLVGVRVEGRPAPGLPALRAPGGQVAEALLALLVNAGEAVASLPPGQRWIRVAARREGGAVRIDVDDGRPGVAEAARREYLQLLAPAALETAALGLSRVRELLTRMDGSLEVERAPEGGARFTIRIPAVAEVPLPRAAPDDTAAVDAEAPRQALGS